MEDIERLLHEGNIIICVNCHLTEIRRGDSYVLRGKYMYCDEECADEDQGKEKST